MAENGLSITSSMAERFGMQPAAFEATLRATVIPKGATREQFAAFLLVAKEHGLNPVTREIYAMPGRGGGIQPIVGVDGWCNIINSHPAFDGMEFHDELDDKGNVASITCRIHRKDRGHPTEATEYLAECAQPTEPWRKWPRRMLRHKAMIQAARYAFSLAGIVDPDEYQRFRPTVDVTPKPAQTVREKLTAIAAPPPPPHDTETGEVEPEPELPIDASVEDDVVDESEPEEWTIVPDSSAFMKGLADGRARTSVCRSTKILNDPELMANWRAGYLIGEEETA
jgi:phage recombination protein Bet